MEGRITFDDFKARYPELVCAGDSNRTQIEATIGESYAIFPSFRCVEIESSIRLAWTAHMIAKSSANPSGMDTSAGPIQSISVGSVSESYAVAQGSNGSVLADFFKSTSYGQKYIYLLKLCSGTGVMTAP